MEWKKKKEESQSVEDSDNDHTQRPRETVNVEMTRGEISFLDVYELTSANDLKKRHMPKVNVEIVERRNGRETMVFAQKTRALNDNVWDHLQQDSPKVQRRLYTFPTTSNIQKLSSMNCNHVSTQI